MKLVLHSQHLALPSDLVAFLQKHVLRPLQRFFDDSAAELAIHLIDARPNRGGVDQQCRMSLRVPGARTLHVESTQADLRQALIDASLRLKRLAKRELAKMRTPSRKPMHRPLGRSWRERSSRRGVTPSGDPSAL